MLASKIIHTEHINVHKTIWDWSKSFGDSLKGMEFSKLTMQQHALCITRTTTTSVQQSSSIKTLDEIQK